MDKQNPTLHSNRYLIGKGFMNSTWQIDLFR